MTELKNARKIGTAILGKAQPDRGDAPRTAELWMGEADWQNTNFRYEVKCPDGSLEDFDGHRTLIDVRLRSENYLKESHLSGDEYRKGGSGEIWADGLQIYEFFFRDIQWALRKADQLIGQLSEHSSDWLIADRRKELLNRKVFYQRTPAVISSLITEQGCIVLKPDGVDKFPPPIWQEEGESYSEYEVSIKTEVLDHAIWWHRKG